MFDPTISDFNMKIEMMNPANPSSQSETNFPKAIHQKNGSWWLIVASMLVCFLVLWLGLRFFVFTNATFEADFYTFWLGGRSVFLEGQSPYRPEVTLQSQMSILGRKANANEDQLAFAYPPYSLLLIFPTIWMDLPWALSYWLAFNLVLVFGACTYLLGKAPRWVLLFVLFYYPLVYSLIIGNFTTILIALLMITISAIVFGFTPTTLTQGILGVLLAWTTVKPQFTWLIILFILIFAVKNHLKVFWLSFLAGLAGMVGFSFLLVPNWATEWVQRLTEYSAYIDTTPLMFLLPENIFPANIAHGVGLLFGVIGGGVTLWLFYRWWLGKLDEFYIVTWICLFSSFIQPNPTSGNHLIFLIPILIWSSRQFWHSRGLVIGTWVGCVVLSWLMFFLSLSHLIPQAVNQYIWVIFACWAVWLFLRRKRNHIQQTSILVE